MVEKNFNHNKDESTITDFKGIIHNNSTIINLDKRLEACNNDYVSRRNTFLDLE
jgi:hypothetical protein